MPRGRKMMVLLKKINTSFTSDKRENVDENNHRKTNSGHMLQNQIL